MNINEEKLKENFESYVYRRSWKMSKHIYLKDFKLTLPKGIDIYVEALGVN